MVTPGIFECAYGELQQVLRGLLDSQIEPDDPAQLCLVKFWDGELSAFVLTNRRALLASWDTAPVSAIESKTAACADFAHVSSVRESERDNSLLTREHCVELWNQGGVLVCFPFLYRDALYQKFLQKVKLSVGEGGKV